MGRIVLVSLLAVLVTDASAQRGAGIGRGFGRVGFGRGGLPQGQFHRNGFGFNRGVAWSGYGFDYGYAEYLPYYDAASAYGHASQPIVIVQQSPVQQPPPPPPREVHPLIIEFPHLAPGSSAPDDGEHQTFGIVLRDGSTRSAVAVVGTADGVLHYVDTEEKNGRISMNEVDREATLKLNRERKLNLWLPATPLSNGGSNANR